MIDVAPTGEIIVEGTTEKEIRGFVWRSVTSMSGRKIAVRSAPVCLGFDNITAELEEQLRARIAENLSAVGKGSGSAGMHTECGKPPIYGKNRNKISASIQQCARQIGSH